MFKVEKICFNFIKKHINFFYLFIITLLAIWIRLAGFNFLSGDMDHFLLPWFDEIKESKLRYTVGNYNLLYQSLIYIMTFIPIKPIYQYKILSCIFDFALAIIVAIFSCELFEKKRWGTHFCIVYSVIIFLPTVILNSGFWGQCDSIYVFFIILSILFLYKEKFIASFSVLGIAFAFKFQTLFIIPFYIYYYFQKQKFSLLHFCITFLVFMSSGLLCFIRGIKIYMPLKIYFGQTKDSHLFRNIHCFWVLLGDNTKFKYFALLFTIFLLGIALYLISKNNLDFNDKNTYLLIATWSVFVCTIFLPNMHERYTYLLDILLIVLAFLDKKYIMLATVSNLLSLITYAKYFGEKVPQQETRFLSLMIVLLFIYFTYLVQKNVKSVEPSQNLINKEKQ